jgi:hypothetical protein
MPWGRFEGSAPGYPAAESVRPFHKNIRDLKNHLHLALYLQNYKASHREEGCLPANVSLGVKWSGELAR